MNYADLISVVTESLLFEEKMAVSLNLAEREGWHGAMLYVEFVPHPGSKGPFKENEEAVLDHLRTQLNKETRACDLLLKNDKHDFLVWLQHVNAEHATRVGERLLEPLSAELEVGSQNVAFEVRIGVALYPYDGKEIAVLSQRAFYAVHQGRVRKRRVHIYDPIAVGTADG